MDSFFLPCDASPIVEDALKEYTRFLGLWVWLVSRDIGTEKNKSSNKWEKVDFFAAESLLSLNDIETHKTPSH